MRRKLIRYLVLSVMLVLLATPGVAHASGVLDQSQTDASGGNALIFGAPAPATTEAQTFTAGVTGGLDRVDLALGKDSSPGAPLIVEIRDTSSGAPGSTVLASTSVPAAGVPATPAWTEVDFGTPAPVAAGTQYAIVAYTASDSTNGSYEWTVAASAAAYTAGNVWENQSSPPGTSWSGPFTHDHSFKTYVTPPVDQSDTATTGSGLALFGGTTVPNTETAQSAAQTFTAGVTGPLVRADLDLEKINSPTAPVTVEIRSTSNGDPSSTVLASASVPASRIGGVAGFVEVDFPSPAQVTAGTHYAIVAYTGENTYLQSYSWILSSNSASTYAGGAAWDTNDSPPGTSWSGPFINDDLAFKTYVVFTDTAPGAPGTPSGSPSPNNTGGHTVSWSSATDGDGDSIDHYVLEHKRSDQSNWSVVSSSVSGTSYRFGSGGNAAEGEGTWVYRVKAVDSHGTVGDSSNTSAAVVVDQTPPSAPTLSADTSASQSSSYFDSVSGITWYKDSELIDASSNGDPVNAADGSTGSGVDPNSFQPTFAVTTDGPSTASQTVNDVAGNTSQAGTLGANVDASPPSVSFSDCPTTPVTVGSSRVIHWNASDGESGLTGASSGTVTLDTSSVGSNTASVPVADNVGHTASATCNYSVGYNILGFFSPAPNSKWSHGQTVPVKIALANAAGTRIPDTQAAALAAACRVTFRATLAQTLAPQCMKYDANSHQFIYNWKLGSKTGAETIAVDVSYPPSTTKTTKSENITIT